MSNAVNLWWWNHLNNFGDLLNPYLVAKISGRPVAFCEKPSHYNPAHLCVGSILGVRFSGRERFFSVWGTGHMTSGVMVTRYQNFHAVRGPLTRQALLDQGLTCPEVYGDPALLLPRYYSPQIKQQYKLGIVPHYIDKKAPWVIAQQAQAASDILFIDIQQPVEAVIRQVLACQAIVSSSLHGLVVADAYGIPSLWVEYGDQVLGQGFKFHDYLLSLGAKPYAPVRLLGPKPGISGLFEQCRHHPVPAKMLDRLLDSCPFRA